MKENQEKFLEMMIESAELFHLSGLQSSEIFDISLSTWNRISNKSFRGYLTFDQKSRAVLFFNLSRYIMRKYITPHSWLSSNLNLKFYNGNRYKLICDFGIIGISMLIFDFQNKDPKSLLYIYHLPDSLP